MRDIFDLDGQIAVVTGALGNLGPIWIDALLGYGTVVCAIDKEGLDISNEYENLMTKYGDSNLRLYRGDVRDREVIEDICNECVGTIGVPSILVNNAGIDRPPSQEGKEYRIEDIPFKENLEIFEVNTFGLFLVTQIFGNQMVKAERGSIINIGSLYTNVAPDARFYEHLRDDPPFLKPPGYGASKAAVVNLTKYLATLWAPHGVRVNVLSPGGVLGNQDEEFKRKYCQRVPLGRMTYPSDLYGPLIFLASEASSYVTGIELKIDGGFTAW